MATAKYKALRAEVEALTNIDDPCNYESADDACESIQSEIEANRDITAEEASDIAGLVTDWFYAE